MEAKNQLNLDTTFEERVLKSASHVWPYWEIGSESLDDIKTAYFGIGGMWRGATFSRDMEMLKEHFELENIFYLQQVHGVTLLPIPEIGNAANPSIQCLGQGDGFWGERSPGQRSNKNGALIFTADCLPVLIHAGSIVLGFHSGWRGLAQNAGGVVANVLLSRLKNLDLNSIVVNIGPHASPGFYEVGHEVIEAIGENVVATQRGERSYLDLAATFRQQFERILPGATWQVSKACTIRMPNKLYSHRREGLTRKGSNVSLIIW